MDFNMVTKDEETALQSDNKHFMDDDSNEYEKMAVIMFYVAVVCIIALFFLISMQCYG